MHLLSLFLIFHIFVFLFCLYLLVQDDFVLLRKNVSLEQVFNIAFLMLFFGFLGSRIIFITLNFKPLFLNPLAFLAFPYFPGFSLIGVVLGGLIFLIGYGKYRKLPTNRLFDFFSFSFFCALSFGYLNDILFEKKPLTSWDFGLAVGYILIFILFSMVFLPLQRRGALKDGILGTLVCLLFALFAFGLNMIHNTHTIIGIFGIEDFLILGFFVITLVSLLLRNRSRKKILHNHSTNSS